MLVDPKQGTPRTAMADALAKALAKTELQGDRKESVLKTDTRHGALKAIVESAVLRTVDGAVVGRGRMVYDPMGDK